MPHSGSVQDLGINPKVIVCRPNDPRLAKGYWSERGGYEQTYGVDEPTYVIVGRLTDDGKCAELAQRFSLDAAALREFRDSGGTALPG